MGCEIIWRDTEAGVEISNFYPSLRVAETYLYKHFVADPNEEGAVVTKIIYKNILLSYDFFTRALTDIIHGGVIYSHE